MKLLTLTVSALLSIGLTSYSCIGNTGSKSSDSSKNNSKNSSNNKSDSNYRGGDSGKNSQTVTICHIPPGNPQNKHTIHISWSAWPAHKLNHGGDWLGSCNNEPHTHSGNVLTGVTTGTTTNVATEQLHVVSGCSDSIRQQIVSKIQSYYDPITVPDNLMDDSAIGPLISQCTDHGDSSDSSKGNSDSSKKDSSGRIIGGKGQGVDSVSDSGNHHRIRDCKNKDTAHKADSNSKIGVITDSDKDPQNLNYHKKLKDYVENYKQKSNITDPIVVSDSSLSDDKEIYAEYKKCAFDSMQPTKISAKRAVTDKGDFGHKQTILKDCPNATTLKKLIEDHKAAEKSTKKDLILTDTIYNDSTISGLVSQCSKDTPLVSSTSSPGGGISGPASWVEVINSSPENDPIKTQKANARAALINNQPVK